MNGDMPAAEADLTEAIRLDPERVESHALLGDVYRQRGNDQKSQAEILRAAKFPVITLRKDAWAWVRPGPVDQTAFPGRRPSDSIGKASMRPVRSVSTPRSRNLPEASPTPSSTTRRQFLAVPVQPSDGKIIDGPR